MSKAHLAVIVSIWATIAAIYGPAAWRRLHGPPPPVPVDLSGDRYFQTSQPGIIFYTTPRNLVLDTATCILVRDGISNGK